jgi:hypothetical protein
LSELEFLYDATLQRLRSRCRWAGPLVALITLLPYEIVDGRPQFLWDMAGELPPAGLVAYLAPAAAGALIVAGGLWARRAASLAVLVLASLAGTALLIRLGADATAWDVLQLPESLSRRPQWALLALALVSAGTVLVARPHARRVARGLLVGAALLAAVFYAWPARGEAPIATIARVLGAIDGDLPIGLNVGFVFLALVALWPGLMALLGLACLRWPPRDAHPVPAIAALYGLPMLLGTMVVQQVLSGQAWNLFASLAGLAVLAGLLSLLAAAIEALGEGLLTPAVAEDLELPPGLAPRRAFALAGGALLLAVGAQAWLAAPPPKGVEWTLTPPSEAADALFGQLVPAWDDARLTWDNRVRTDSGAQAMVEVQHAAHEMIEAARPLDAGLAAALEDLARESRDLGMAGRRWYRLVAGVNEACRRAGLPYYLDPTALIFQTGDGLRRHFRVRAYRIDRVHRYAADGDPFAALEVTRLDEDGGQDTRLGFSRDLQPFALVLKGEIDGFEVDLAALAHDHPPRCADTAVWGPPAPGLRRCGEVLATLLDQLGGDLAPALTAITERHELQHQIDGPHLPVAGPVLERLEGYDERVQQRVNRELSAYLAELTTPAAPPALGVLHLYRFTLIGDGGTEFEVAVIGLAALSGKQITDADGKLDRAAALAAFDALVALPEPELRARASSAWSDLFGHRLAAVSALDAPEATAKAP